MKIAEVRKLALSLPDTAEAPHFNYSSFRVRGKIFATVPPDETFVHVFVSDEGRERALVLHPDCLEKLMWGAKVVGVRVALAKVKPALVSALLREAWKRKAPKTLVATLPSENPSSRT
jgi:hypothetical protein